MDGPRGASSSYMPVLRRDDVVFWPASISDPLPRVGALKGVSAAGCCIMAHSLLVVCSSSSLTANSSAKMPAMSRA
jgi:hypothetical protein